ncbi:MAG: aminotransferase class V-fold PLP-dependent enzyme, partial [Pseudobdellovibrio sp.]
LPEYRGKKAKTPMPYPREADDFYHASKINDTNYISIACRKWGLRITDIMQSTVFGSWTEEIDDHIELHTRMDYDETFGTVANRFMVQALAGKPLSIYGTGHQRTGLMALNDCIISLSTLWNEVPSRGTHRVINHLTEESYSINELAHTIKNIADEEGLKVDLQQGIHDPRGENTPVKLGYTIERQHVSRNLTATPLRDIISKTFRMILPYKKLVNNECLFPVTLWDHHHAQIKPEIANNSAPADTKVAASALSENDWENYRSKHFPNLAVNLNPGTLGTPSIDALEAMRKFATDDLLGSPREQYQQGQEAMLASAATAEKLWPSAEHSLHIAPSATQSSNLMALALARVSSQRKRPLRVLTTAHEHIGGLGALIKMREFGVVYLSEHEMQDLSAFKQRVIKSKPDIGFFSHITYDRGQVLPVSDWAAILKNLNSEALVLVDISQSLGLLPPPFEQTDMLFSSGHKWLFGPRGSGLLWTTARFRKEVEALHWAGESFSDDSKHSGFILSGGMDFSVFAGLDAALKLHQKTGEEKIRARGLQLKNFFHHDFSNILKKHRINHEFIQTQVGTSQDVGILTFTFQDYDPYPLYQAMNRIKLHCKCIKGADLNAKPRQILRFGFPYYETKSRLDKKLAVLDQFLQESLPEKISSSRKPTPASVEVEHSIRL